ncbi:heptaprenyl diphosphate synthase [Isoptericola sp. CG 20/1183]|uniref:Heptaprenyl diphosphate synthase n=1 Tax=Isoptericola halotolerans TaxID=300560 RepID=A0ABX5ELG3_9MICO|nr:MULTISPECIES: polyprenyl synthetase family protein [Isoptericola]MCK0118032.1 polyprenyl synthetase family protein [Isoptericola sp. S6320L]PRZ09702.1 heptaprenyl diphosphate synthase [Isoptericola sp. CG 20/1183]PRZ10503.1 heptaprenyl diphosphate synthase [Isoptericola halotolerans]
MTRASDASAGASATLPTAIPVSDPELADRLAGRLARVDAVLAEAVASTDRLADDASRHLIAAGGKRFRPLLTLLAGELGDGEDPRLVDAAVVVELTQVASLYHDDVMDSAPVRRGAPAAHTVWGNSIAILVGDLLFARASALVAGLGPEAVVLQSHTFERMCLGQLHETTGPAAGDDPVDHYLQVLSDKTASLLATSARLGAMFGGCPDEIVEAVTGYGEKVGTAFQLADDVLDIASSGTESGKTPGTDLREHVPTMPVLLLRRRVERGEASPSDTALLARLDGDLSDDAALAAVVADLREHSVLAETRELAVRWAREAAAELAPLPDGPVKQAFGDLATALADRAA